ncbi:MAG TPA: hypothetical protein VMX11_08940, partial [Actinomycetes bacterium]|nr:hypothetical protein [Actinomycetes bacterium]
SKRRTKPDIRLHDHRERRPGQLLSKASSKAQGWMVSTKAYEIPGAGCLVNVTQQQGDHVADALQWVPGVRVAPDDNDGRQLVPLASE